MHRRVESELRVLRWMRMSLPLDDLERAEQRGDVERARDLASATADAGLQLVTLDLRRHGETAAYGARSHVLVEGEDLTGQTHRAVDLGCGVADVHGATGAASPLDVGGLVRRHEPRDVDLREVRDGDVWRQRSHDERDGRRFVVERSGPQRLERRVDVDLFACFLGQLAM